MKKILTNAEIVKIYNTLMSIKNSPNIAPGDSSIYWANNVNISTLKPKAEMIQDTVNEVINSYFTDENTHTSKDASGKEIKVLNDEIKDDVIAKINHDVNELENKTVEVVLESITKEAFEVMIKTNEKTMSMAQMDVMGMFIESDSEK